MPAPTSTPELLDLVRLSGLLPAAEVDRLAAGPATADRPGQTAAALVKQGSLTKFQAKLLLAGKHRGFRLGAYVVRDQIGQGGMGAVYLAEHETLKRLVALKVLTGLGSSQDSLTLGRFLREARAAAALDHPNVVRIFDIGTQGGTHYLVHEFVDGRTLDKVVAAGGRLPPARAAEYAAQAAAGLQHAHERGFVHRDIKPANLILSNDGTIKILDMGLTRSGHKDDKLTEMMDKGAIVGTADYIAPEQATQGPDADARVDIYSLGATLYTLLSGRPPFSGTATQKLLAHQMKSPPSLTATVPECPPGLADVVGTMMAKGPSARYQTAAEVVAALAPWVPASGTGRLSAGMSGTAVGSGAVPADLKPTLIEIAAASTRRLNKPGVPTVPVPRPGSRPAPAAPRDEPLRARVRRRGRQKDKPAAGWPLTAAVAAVVVGVGVAGAVLLLRPASTKSKTTAPAQAVAAAAAPVPPSGADAVRPLDIRPGRCQPLPLDKVATAVSTRGMFYPDKPNEQMVLPDWKPRTVAGVPFAPTDPQGDRVPNVVLLQSPRAPLTQNLPAAVGLPCGLPAKAIHLLGGVAGWGFPMIEKGSVSLVVRLHYADGATETHALRNGDQVADYIRRIDVPGSRFGLELAGGQQLRVVTVRPGRADRIDRIEFAKGTDETAPIVMAVTVEAPDDAARIDLRPDTAGRSVEPVLAAMRAAVAAEQWADAARQAVLAARLQPDFHFHYYQAAAFLARVGPGSGYEEFRAEMLDRFGQSTVPETGERTAKVCLILPGTPDQTTACRRLAETAYGQSPAGQFLRQYLDLVLGLADFRRGEFAAADARLDRVAAGGGSWNVAIPSRLVVALARLKLGRAEEARAAAAAAADEFERFTNGRGAAAAPGEPHDYAMVQILMAEYDRLAAGTAAAR